MIDAREFERRAGEHIDAAYNLAYWLVGNRDDAKHVVQDAYLRACRGFEGLAGADIKPWLLTIVRNVAYRWLELRKRHANVISFEGALAARSAEDARAFDVASDELTAEELLIGRDERVDVRRALATLPPIFREVLVLREFEELSYQEIARATGVPMGTVMSRIARARDQLRAALSDRGGEPGCVVSGLA